MLLKLKGLANGYTEITNMQGCCKDMLMDIGILKASKGQKVELIEKDKEIALLLIEGTVVFKWGKQQEEATRNSIFDEEPSVLHVCKNTAVSLYAHSDVEILIQKTTNDSEFKSKFYYPKDCNMQILGDNVMGSMAKRLIRTVFDYTNAPYSNLVLGEVINFPGRWSSYIPHGHDQPEVYFYKFDKANGFGAGFIGDEVYKIVNNSALCIPGGPTHPQVTAPGYAMWYCWMIRHYENNPWNKRVNDLSHEWLLNENNKIWPEK